MNPIAFAVAAYIFLGLDASLRGPLSIGNSSAAPNFMAMLAVFIAVHVSPRTAPWLCLLLGLLVDLITFRPIAGGEAITLIFGSSALGYFAAGHLIVSLRGVMLRRNPFAFMFLCACFVALAQLVTVVILTLRSFLDPAFPWSPMSEFFARMGAALWTSVISLLLGPVLNRLQPLFGFVDFSGRRPSRR